MPVAGPFYFARVDANVAFNSGAHNVMDFYILSFTLEQAETEHASLSIEVKNPGIDGLIAPGVPIWGWFSWFNGSSIEELFYGRLVAIPSNLLASVVTLKFVARPDDYETQRQAIAQDIRDAGPPFWEPLLIDEAHQEDVDAVLEAVSSDWHTDRTSLVVSLSDLLVGEDGTVDFALGEAFIDEVDVQISDAPKGAVDCELTVPWKQTHGGQIDFGTYNWTGAGARNVAAEWPKTGDQLSGGWSVVSAAAVSPINGGEVKTMSYDFNWQNQEKEHRDGDTMSVQEHYSGPAVTPINSIIRTGVVTRRWAVNGDPATGTPASAGYEMAGIYIPTGVIGAFSTSIVLGYGANRDRTEKLTFTVRADLQEVLRSADDEQVPDKIALSGRSVTDGDVPVMDDPSSPSYFMTPRGDQTAQYGIMLCVARLRLGSRIVRGTWGTTFARATELSLRKSAHLEDPRLQHGEITGKIIAYSMIGNGDSGVFKGTVTVGACIGLGNAIEESVGTPTYVEEGYVDPPYQMYENQAIAIGNGDIAYSPPIIVPNDDGLIFPLTKDQVVVTEIIHRDEFVEPDNPKPMPTVNDYIGTIGGQSNLIGNTSAYLEAVMEWRAAYAVWLAEQQLNYQSWLELELKAIDKGNFGSEAVMTVSNLVLPMGYDVSSPIS